MTKNMAIVTTSSASIPPEMARELGIVILPNTLKLGQKAWKEGEEIDLSSFYMMMKTASELPQIEPPDTTAFQNIFADLSRKRGADGIVAILPSGGSFSKSLMDSARAAQNFVRNTPVEILESGGSMLTGFPALASAKAAAAGADVQAVSQTAQKVIASSRLYIMIDSFDYLCRNYKVGKAAGLIGNFLKIKPIFKLEKGETSVVGRPSGASQVKLKLQELWEQELRDKGAAHCAVFHVDNPKGAADYLKTLTAKYQPVETLEVECCAEIGMLTGPGTVGIAFYAE